jgi:uncharacterized protein YkwD
MSSRYLLRRNLFVQRLEERCNPSSVSADEQYFLELINRGRADPAADATRFGIELNEGLPAGTIPAAAVQPLVPNAALQAAIEGHLTYLAQNGLFTHVGADGSMPWDRAAAAGYPSTTVGENLAYQTGSLSTAALDELYRSLFVDAGVDGRGHRVNLLNGLYGDVGTGVATGLTPGGAGVVIGQDFGSAPGTTYLTGVAYTDAVVADHFYTPGEGLGGLSVVAVGATGTFSAITNPAGGYALALPAGAYTVTVKTAVAKDLAQYTVTVGSVNVKLDYEGSGIPTNSPPDQTLLGGWRVAAPFARGQIAVDWSTRRLWMAGFGQSNDIYEFDIPDMGTGEDPSTWPVLQPTKVIPAFWPGGWPVYANGMIFWQGELWVSPRMTYDTAPPDTLTLYSESGRTLTVDLPRQQFSGFIKRFGQDPLLGSGGTESGQGSARGPTAAGLDGTVYLGPWNYGAGWDGREVRPADYYPVNHVDAWYALDPANHGDGTQGRWASDQIYGGGLWLPEGVAYWPLMGTGDIDYAYQNLTLSATTETVEYLYDPTTWRPTFSVTSFGPIDGQDFGPNGEVVLSEGNAWQSQMYQVDPIIRVYQSLPATLPPSTPLPPIPPAVPPAPPAVPPAPPVVHSNPWVLPPDPPVVPSDPWILPPTPPVVPLATPVVPSAPPVALPVVPPAPPIVPPGPWNLP